MRGGLQFATDSNPGFYDADKNNVQPRAGFAYSLTDTTVLRGGCGRLHGAEHHLRQLPAGLLGGSTPIVPSLDNGLTFRANLTNPFPDGVQDPVGDALGADTFLGRELERVVPLDFGNAQNMRYIVSVQRRAAGAVAGRSGVCAAAAAGTSRRAAAGRPARSS